MRVRLAFVGVALSLTVACSSSEERVEAARADIQVALANEDIQGALDAYQVLREELPDTPETEIDLARVLTRMGEVPQAVWLLERAMKRFPERADLRLGYAESALTVGDAALALKALEGVPSDSERWDLVAILRARAHAQLGQLQLGLETLERAAERDPKNINIFQERLRILTEEHRYEESLELSEAMLALPDLDPGLRAAVHLKRADFLMAAKRVDEALEVLAAVIAEEPRAGHAWQRRAILLTQTRRAEQAREELTQALERDPEYLPLYRSLAAVERAMGKPEREIEILREVCERQPTPEHFEALAQALHQNGDPAGAAAAMGKGVDLQGRGSSPALEHAEIAFYLSAEDLDRARQLHGEFVRNHPRSPLGEYLLARFELAEGEPESARDRLKRTVSRLDRADIQHWLGVANEQLGDLEGAEFRFALAIRRRMREAPSYLALISVLERQRKWDLMAHYAKELVSFAPANPIGLDALMRALIHSGKLAEAENVVRAYGARFPNLPGPPVALSNLLRMTGRPQDALVILDLARPQFEDDALVASELAFALGQLGRLDEAHQVLDEAAVADAENPALHRARAYLYLRANRDADAVAEVDRVLELDPLSGPPVQMLGDYYSIRGNHERAAEQYRRYLEIQPYDAAVMFRLGVALDRIGDTAGAIEAYQRAAKVDRHALGPRNNLALLLEREGRLDEALAAAQEAFALANSEPAILDTLGWIYFRKGMTDRSVALLEKANRAAPESAETRFHLALAYREAGELPKALVILEDLQHELDAEDALYARVGEAVASLQ